MSPVSTSQPSSGFKVPKIVIDLFFTLAIPITLLASKLPFTDFNFSDTLGTRPTFVLAGIIPAAYILWDTWKTRKFNPVNALAAGSALTGGALAFLQIDGWKFALKDSYSSIVVALVMGISLLIRQPFFGFILKVAATASRDQEEAMHRLLLAPTVRETLFWSTFIILVEALINGTLNFWVNLQNVTENFGSKAFNNQVAEVNAMMRLPSFVLTFIAYGLAFHAVRWAVVTDFGPKVKLFEEGFFEALEESIAHKPSDTPDTQRSTGM